MYLGLYIVRMPTRRSVIDALRGVSWSRTVSPSPLRAFGGEDVRIQQAVNSAHLESFFYPLGISFAFGVLEKAEY